MFENIMLITFHQNTLKQHEFKIRQNKKEQRRENCETVQIRIWSPLVMEQTKGIKKNVTTPEIHKPILTQISE